MTNVVRWCFPCDAFQQRILLLNLGLHRAKAKSGEETTHLLQNREKPVWCHMTVTWSSVVGSAVGAGGSTRRGCASFTTVTTTQEYTSLSCSQPRGLKIICCLFQEEWEATQLNTISRNFFNINIQYARVMKHPMPVAWESGLGYLEIAVTKPNCKTVQHLEQRSNFKPCFFERKGEADSSDKGTWYRTSRMTA